MILDLFAGPGGWSEGLRLLGLPELGVEWDDKACATRVVAGHATLQADIASLPTAPFVGEYEGLIASPPCTDFSSAGKRLGVDGTSGHLVTQVLRWVNDLRPAWVACEQVPPVLPIWLDYAEQLREWGYEAWAGVLNAADYGVPQTRKRAVLMASRVAPVAPPTPTHSKEPTLTTKAWVTMGQALSWSTTSTEFSYSVSTGERQKLTRDEANVSWSADDVVLNTGRDWKKGKGRDDAQKIPLSQPAPTLTGQCSAWWFQNTAGERPYPAAPFTTTDAQVLQGFPADYPVQGKRAEQFTQIGNAVPPPLAAHVVKALTQSSVTVSSIEVSR